MSFAKGLEDLASGYKPDAPEEKPVEEQASAEQPSVEAQQPAQQAQATEVQQPEVQQPQPEVEEPEEKVISAGGMDIKIKKTEEPTQAVDVTDTETFFETIEREHGIKLDSLKNAADMFGQIKKADELKDKLTETELKAAEVTNFFTSLPVEIKASIQAYAEGKDYKGVLKKVVGGTLDYSKPATYYSQKDMIRAYNPDISSDDMEDMTDREAKALYDSAVLRYESEHKEYSQNTERLVKDSEQKAMVFLDSVKETLSELDKTEYNIKKDTKSYLENKMKSNISDLFFNDKGQYHKDAAEKLYFAIHGKEIVQALISEIEKTSSRKIKQAESQTAEKIVSEYTNDKLKPSTGGSTPITIEDAVKNTLPKALGGNL